MCIFGSMFQIIPVSLLCYETNSKNLFSSHLPPILWKLHIHTIKSGLAYRINLMYTKVWLDYAVLNPIHITSTWYGTDEWSSPLWKERNYIRVRSYPLRTQIWIRNIPLKAGCSVKLWAVHWRQSLKFKRALKKKSIIKDLNGQAWFLKEVLLQVSGVETGNVSTDVRYNMNI